MAMIIYVGMDVHKESYTVCCYNQESDKALKAQTLPPDHLMVLKYLNAVKKAWKKQAVKK